MTLQDRATLWLDTCRVLTFDAIEADNDNRIGESRNLACVLQATLSELEDAKDEQEREEVLWELGQAVEIVKERVIGLIAEPEDGGRHTLIEQSNKQLNND